MAARTAPAAGSPPAGGRRNAAAEVPNGWSGVQPARSGVPDVECADPHAEPLVTTELMVLNSVRGSRGGRVAAGTSASRGTDAASGARQAGWTVGAPAAGLGAATGTSSGSAAGVWKAAGRSRGAYSGPSVQFAMGS